MRFGLRTLVIIRSVVCENNNLDATQIDRNNIQTLMVAMQLKRRRVYDVTFFFCCLSFIGACGCDRSSPGHAPLSHRNPGLTKAAFAFEDDKAQWGFISGRGEIVLAPRFSHAIDFEHGLARVQAEDQLLYIDQNGHEVFRLPRGTRSTLAIREVYVWFEAANGKWGFCDTRGRIVLEPTYDDAHPFSEGLAAVNIGAKWEHPGIVMGGSWGYVSTNGQLIIPVQHQSADNFSEGLARVANDVGSTYRIQFIDRTGQAVITVDDAYTGEFREGLAPIYSNGGAWRTQFIDKTGAVQLTVQGHAAEYHEGLSAVTLDRHSGNGKEGRRCGYINRHGRFVILPRFANAMEFSEGLAAVRMSKDATRAKQELWGYIDRSGRFAIDPIFNEANSFHGGFAKVHLGGELIDADDGPSVWSGGEWLLIDDQGTVIAKL